MKIFGEDHFIDNTICEIIEDYNHKVDKIFFDEMTKTLKYTMPEIKVDAQKLRKWIVLCMKLENIDKSNLIDIAVKKKFAKKDQELVLYKKALELACERLSREDVFKSQSIPKFYLKQAKEEIDEQKASKEKCEKTP